MTGAEQASRSRGYRVARIAFFVLVGILAMPVVLIMLLASIAEEGRR